VIGGQNGVELNAVKVPITRIIGSVRGLLSSARTTFDGYMFWLGLFQSDVL